NAFLVNGDSRYELHVQRGEIVRFYFTNVSSARPYNLSFASPSGAARMKLVAGDGGKLEHEQWVESVVLAPAERHVVDVEFSHSGRVALVNRVQALDHMIGSYSPEIDTLGSVVVSDVPAERHFVAQFDTLRRNVDVARELAPYRRHFSRPPDHTLV